jgi:hypothetical protein
MALSFRLEGEDGAPADPPALNQLATRRHDPTRAKDAPRGRRQKAEERDEIPCSIYTASRLL